MALNIFRRSLFLKVFTLSSVISIALIYFLGSNLYTRIADGIFEEKIAASITAGDSAIQNANYRFIIASLNRSTDIASLVAELVNSSDVSAKDSGREIAFFNSKDKEIRNIPAVTTSNFLEPASISDKLRSKVQKDDAIHWERTKLKYINGEILNGMAVS